MCIPVLLLFMWSDHHATYAFITELNNYKTEYLSG